MIHANYIMDDARFPLVAETVDFARWPFVADRIDMCHWVQYIDTVGDLVDNRDDFELIKGTCTTLVLFADNTMAVTTKSGLAAYLARVGQVAK